MAILDHAWLLHFNTDPAVYPAGETLGVAVHRGYFALGGGTRYAMQWRLGTAAGVASYIHFYRTAAPKGILAPDNGLPDLDPATNTWWVRDLDLAFPSIPNGAAGASHPVQFSGTAWTYMMIEINVTTQIDQFFLAVSKK